MPCKDMEGGTQGGGHAAMKAETGVMPLPAKEHRGWWQQQKLGTGWGQELPQSLRKEPSSASALISDFRPPQLREN